MPLVLKDVLYPGTYRLPGGRQVTFTSADVKHLARRMQDMTAAGLQIPAAWEHQDRAKPMTADETAALRAEKVKLTLGHAHDAVVDPKGYLVAALDVPDSKDVERLPKVRFVSPEIVEDFVDGTGRKWPGKSISHIAITPRPVQHHQRPFGATTQLSVIRLSLGDIRMARDEEEAQRRNQQDEDTPPAEGRSITDVLAALAEYGIVLPDDTDEGNFYDRLCTAVRALKGKTEEESDEPEPEEVSAPVAMSMQKRLETLERNGIQARIKALFPARINKPLRDKMLAESKTIQLSFDTQTGELVPNKLLAKIEAYEELPVSSSFTGGSDSTRLSLGDEVREEEPPAGDGPQSQEDVDKAVAAYEKLVGRGSHNGR